MRIFIVLSMSLFLIVGLISAQDVPQGENLQCPVDFKGYLSPRLTVGELARTTPDNPLNLRPEPGTSIARIGVIREGVTVEIEAGPLCNEGFIWWQTTYDDLTGWVAEGTSDGGDEGDEYWLTPRGERILITDDDGVERAYVADEDGNLEPEDCMKPPDDYTRIQEGYATLNARTAAMLDHAQRIYSRGGGPVAFRQSITQGSYNPGGVSASFGTHDGGGAVDISVRSFIDWSVLTTEIEPMIEALRIAGFAAWLRAPGDLYENSPIHIHAIAIGDVEQSPIAREQVDGEFGYLRGYDGLPREDGIPVEDRHGGPILCNWMRELGYDDMRHDLQDNADPARVIASNSSYRFYPCMTRFSPHPKSLSLRRGT